MADYDDIRRLAGAVQGQGEPDLEQLRALRDAVDDLLDARDEEQAEQLESFIEGIGRSMYEAQRDLDRTSQSYLAGQPPLASVFRIPRLSAELQLSLAASRQRGSGFILRRRRSSEDTSQQQKISFEVVAAPAPPEVLQGYRALSLPIVTDPLLRAELRERVKTLAAAGGGLPAERASAFDAAFERVLVVAGEAWWILLLALPDPAAPEDEERCNLDALYVQRPRAGTAVAGEAHYRGGGASLGALPARLRRLAWLLHGLAVRQAGPPAAD